MKSLPGKVLAAALIITALAGSASVPEAMVAAPLPKTSRMSITVRLNEAGAVTTANAYGLFDFTHELGAFAIHVGGALIPRTTLQALFIAPAIYLNSPLLDALVGSTKPWIKLNFGTLAARQAIVALATQAPMSARGIMREASGLKKLGSSRVRGVSTTRYSLNVNPRKAGGKALSGLLSRFGVGRFPLEIWVDAHGRIRRIRFTIDSSKFKNLGLGTFVLSFSMDFYGFGVPVHVTAPPADQVTPITFPLRRIA
ncbi:MAG: hypothetical protein ACYDCC_07680 [Actinomycetota bacterium]